MIALQIKKKNKIYFAGDFHLGKPDKDSSLSREKKIIEWLNHIKKDAQDVFLMGDLFDFWFEYKNVIPKDNLRFLSTISNLIDEGITIHYFIGNHDLWVINYFKELGIKVYDKPQNFKINEKILLIGHGDGLGKGDTGYKFLKRIFKNNQGSILRTIVYTIGHFAIAITVLMLIADVSFMIALTDAIVEPIANSVWYFILDKWWASKSKK